MQTEQEQLDYINKECNTHYTSLEEVDWNHISSYKFLSEDFIRDFKDKVKWYYISYFQKLSEDFIREFADKVNWNCISEYQKLSEEFIKVFKDKVDWKHMSYYQELSEDFIREFKDYVDWKFISFQAKLSENFIREFQDKVHWTSISSHQKLSEDFIREFKDYVDWHSISFQPNLSENFIREFADKLDWYYISVYQKLSEDFIREFADKVDWECIPKFQKLSEDFIQEFKELIIDDSNKQDININNTPNENVSVEPLESKDDNKREEVLNITFTEEELLEKLKNPELPKLISDIQDLESTVENIKIDCSRLNFSNLEIKYKGNDSFFSDERHNIIDFDNKIFTGSELEEIISLLVEYYNSKLNKLKKQYLNIFYGDKFKTEITE